MDGDAQSSEKITSKSPRYSIVLPCYNEAESIPSILQNFREFSDQLDLEVVLVNNGSKDHTQEVLDRELQLPENYFARVVHIEENMGYGCGIHTGLKQAQADVIGYSHADGQTPPVDILKAFKLVENGDVNLDSEVLKGYRRGRDESNPLTRGLGKIVSYILGYKFLDINGQPKVFSRDFYNSLKYPPLDFSYDTYVLFESARQGYKLRTFDVEFWERKFGESKWANSIRSKYKTIFWYLINICKTAWIYRHEKNNLLGQSLRFMQTGILTNIANYLAFFLSYKLLSVNHLVANPIGFFTGFFLGYSLNRTFTFGAQKGSHKTQFILFCLVNFLSFGIGLLTIFLLVDMGTMPPELGHILAILASAVTNFLGYKLLVFQNGEKYARTGTGS